MFRTLPAADTPVLESKATLRAAYGVGIIVAPGATAAPKSEEGWVIPRPTAARFMLRDPIEVCAFVEHVCDEVEKHGTVARGGK